MLIAISIISSIIYWISSNYGLQKYITIPVKILAIIPLIFIQSNSSFIFIIYSIGDVLLFFNIEYSMIAFILGHGFFILNHISNPIIIFDTFPFIAFSTFLISKLFPDKLIYVSYIICLHLLFVYSVYDHNYYSVLFILSDALIGFDSKYTKWFTWPFYYIAVIKSYNII